MVGARFLEVGTIEDNIFEKRPSKKAKGKDKTNRVMYAVVNDPCYVMEKVSGEW